MIGLYKDRLPVLLKLDDDQFWLYSLVKYIPSLFEVLERGFLVIILFSS